MKTKILSELKTKFKHLGLSDDIYEGVANQLALSVKEETEIATAASGAEQLLKAMQKYADTRVNSVKTQAETYKAQLEELQGKKTEDPAPKNTGKGEEEIPSWAKSLMQSIESLQGEKTHQTLSSKLLGALSEKKIPESFYSPALTGRKFSKDDEVDALVQAVSTSYEKFQQEQANTNGGVPPESGKGQPKSDAEGLAAMINKGTEAINNAKK